MASEEGARELDRQLARLDAGRDALAREVSLLHESIREREGELEETRAESRAARETAEALERGNASLAESIRQKRGIEAKVLEEASRVAEALAGVAERMAALERGAELGPVVVEMRREVERAREEGREDRVRLAQSEAQLRDAQDAAARAAAAAAHLRETLAAVEAERDRIEDLLRRERRQGADRTRSFGKRLEELEARPPAGSDPAAWERLQAQFESRLRDSARRVAELESETAAMRAELENARSLLARATVERQQLRARLESMEMASVSAAAGGQADALRADLRRTELERDEARRDIAALKSRIDTLEHSRKELEGRRAKAEEELRSRSGEGFFRKIARAFARE
jgi:chromosome segregation ATPase